MNSTDEQRASDWADNLRAFIFAWGLPSLAIIVGSQFHASARSLVWSLSLAYMGTACLINARRCGRMHCRYTGPYYLIMIIPVLLLGSNVLSAGPYGWWILGMAILFGGKIIWWATENAWGKYVR